MGIYGNMDALVSEALPVNHQCLRGSSAHAEETAGASWQVTSIGENGPNRFCTHRHGHTHTHTISIYIICNYIHKYMH